MVGFDIEYAGRTRFILPDLRSSPREPSVLIGARGRRPSTDIKTEASLQGKTAIGAAVVGCGYWGPNLARNLVERPEFRADGLCDRDPAQLRTLAQRHPQARGVHDLDALLCDPTRSRRS